jgi:putative hydrolase of the HAD superfamily
MADNSQHIMALFLDIGGVLLTNGWDGGIRRKAAENFGLDFDDLNERHHLTFDTYEEGKLTLDEYLNRVIFFEERPFSRDDFKTYMYAQSRPIPDMLAYVRELKRRFQLKILTVSNEGRELTLHRIQHFGLRDFVDGFVSSCFVHFRKPDVDIFRIALDIAQVPPERVVYIDDRNLFVEVACSLGIHGIHHTALESTQKELSDLGLALPEKVA